MTSPCSARHRYQRDELIDPRGPARRSFANGQRDNEFPWSELAGLEKKTGSKSAINMFNRPVKYLSGQVKEELPLSIWSGGASWDTIVCGKCLYKLVSKWQQTNIHVNIRHFDRHNFKRGEKSAWSFERLIRVYLYNTFYQSLVIFICWTVVAICRDLISFFHQLTNANAHLLIYFFT